MGAKSGIREVRGATHELLTGLGTGPEEVAQALAFHGVRGRPKSASNCAVAVYLRAVMTTDTRIVAIEVYHRFVRVRLDGRRRPVLVPLPAPVRAFIGPFDAGSFPALVRSAGTGVPISGAVAGTS